MLDQLPLSQPSLGLNNNILFFALILVFSISSCISTKEAVNKEYFIDYEIVEIEGVWNVTLKRPISGYGYYEFETRFIGDDVSYYAANSYDIGSVFLNKCPYSDLKELNSRALDSLKFQHFIESDKLLKDINDTIEYNQVNLFENSSTSYLPIWSFNIKGMAFLIKNVECEHRLINCFGELKPPFLVLIGFDEVSPLTMKQTYSMNYRKLIKRIPYQGCVN